MNKWTLGDFVTAEVFEKAGEQSYLLSFEGRLVRILNQTHQNLKIGQKVQLVVIGINPLKLQLKLDYLSKTDRFI